jgi:hypothetical protein
MGTRKLHALLRVVAVTTTVAYLGMFLWKLWSRSNMLHETGADIDWAVPSTPQSMIALCLMTATVALVFLRFGGRVLAAGLFIVVLAFYGQWAFLTISVRENIGLPSIPGEGVIGNKLIGANVLDVYVLLAVLMMVVVSGILTWRERHEISGGKQSLHAYHS